MKKDLALTVISLVCLTAGFVMFVAGFRYGIVLTLAGVFIYLYLNKKKKEESAQNSG
jgi:hypothetical protein